MNVRTVGAPKVTEFSFPEFVPAFMLKNPHLQTIFGRYLGTPWSTDMAIQHHVPTGDGDQIVLHASGQLDPSSGARSVLLVHGLAGCHGSPYMRRITRKLGRRGHRVIRMDLRGAGAGARLASKPYHAGCSSDVAAAIHYLARAFPDTPISVVGFSMGGNVVLKLLGESEQESLSHVDSAFVVSPPIDLITCALAFQQNATAYYERRFVRWIIGQLRPLLKRRPAAERPDLHPPPTSLWEFDDRFTAPLNGFRDAEDYYQRCSAKPLLPNIRIPTLILTAADDPLVPSAMFDDVNTPDCIQLLKTPHGGHMGYVGRGGVDPDRRWMDWRIVDWITLAG